MERKEGKEEGFRSFMELQEFLAKKINEKPGIVPLDKTSLNIWKFTVHVFTVDEAPSQASTLRVRALIYEF